MQRLLVVTALLALAVPAVSAQTLTTVYSNDFEISVGPEWSKDIRTTTPVGLNHFLGRFGGESVALDLYDLPPHCSVTVTYELYVIGSWDGSVGPNAGPDIWDMNASNPTDCCGVQNLLHTTFASCDWEFQAYPDNYPDVHLPGQTGAAAVDTLGYDEDAVYELSFTFYHDRDDLRLTFAATPNLESITNESWGIDNIVVGVNAASCCRATRSLPTTYGPGSRLPVAIEVVPSPGTQAWVLEEDPPSDFNVYGVNDGGLVDSDTGMIKWGPFFGDAPRTLHYTTTVPSWLSGNLQPLGFAGTATVDGDVEAVCGDRQVVAGDTHPADLDGDFTIEGDELTAYAAAWRHGDDWSVVPTSIPSSLVTNAALIWRAGESYHYEPTAAPPWVPDAGFAGKSGTADSSLERRSGGAVTVHLDVAPESGAFAYVVEEIVPAGWSVRDMDNGAVYEPGSRIVRWGPYFDDTPRALSYTLAPTGGRTPLAVVEGVAAFDGSAVKVTGARLLSGGPAGRAAVAAD